MPHLTPEEDLALSLIFRFLGEKSRTLVRSLMLSGMSSELPEGLRLPAILRY